MYACRVPAFGSAIGALCTKASNSESGCSEALLQGLLAAVLHKALARVFFGFRGGGLLAPAGFCLRVRWCVVSM
jgi:hypothetical protein